MDDEAKEVLVVGREIPVVVLPELLEDTEEMDARRDAVMGVDVLGDKVLRPTAPLDMLNRLAIRRATPSS